MSRRFFFSFCISKERNRTMIELKPQTLALLDEIESRLDPDI